MRETGPLEEAIAYFKLAGEDDKVRLLKYRQRPDLVLYRAGETRDYHHGYMVPSSATSNGSISTCWIKPYIRFPRRHAPSVVLPMEVIPPF